MPLNLTWVTLSATEGLVHPGQVKRHSLPFQAEAVLKYLMVPLTFALDCTCVTETVLMARKAGDRSRATNKHTYASD